MSAITYFSTIGVFKPPFMYDDFDYLRTDIKP